MVASKYQQVPMPSAKNDRRSKSMQKNSNSTSLDTVCALTFATLLE